MLQLFAPLKCFPIFCLSWFLLLFFFQLSSLHLSNCRHMLASNESNNNSSNLSGTDSTRRSLKETQCSVASTSDNHQTHAERIATANGQLLSDHYPRTVAQRWAAPRDASPLPQSFIQTWTAGTAARPTRYPRTLRTRTRV